MARRLPVGAEATLGGGHFRVWAPRRQRVEVVFERGADLGPDGCYLREFSVDYFTDRYENDWGEPINFGGQE